MRLVKPLLAFAAIAAVALLVLWQTGVVNFASDDAPPEREALIAPADMRLVSALRIVAETQRIREMLGEATQGDRMGAMRAAALALDADTSTGRIAELKSARAEAAARLLVLARQSVAAPQWPPGDADVHAAYADALIHEAQIGLLSANVSGIGVAEALEPAATALALARGIIDPPPSFLMISSDVGDALKSLPAPELRQPQRGDLPVPETALPVPMGTQP